MPKFKKEKFHFEDSREREHSDILKFDADIYVSADGTFYTNLDRAVIEKFKAVGINTGQRTKKSADGYYEGETYKDLLEKISALGNDYVTKEIVSQSLKIQYSIETDCHYAKDENGCHPNGYYINEKKDEVYWRSGTKRDLHSGLTTYGLEIYAQPFCEQIFRYRSGKTFTKQLFHHNYLDGLGENGKWLRDIVRQKEPGNGTIREIEYTEEIAGFFRSMFESLFGINEKLKGFLEPERIRLAAYQGRNLLGGK